MATSGSVTVKVTGYDNLVFSWELKSQSIENNSSVVGWSMSLVAGSSGAIDSNIKKAWEVTVNGNSYTGTAITGIGNNQTKVLASGSTTIPHNADGTKTFAFTFKQVFKGLVFAGEAVSDKSGSGNGILPTIARASQPSAVTWPEHTQNVGSFGDTISIHMNRKADTFTHTVRYKFGSASGVIARDVTTGTTWTIPLTLMSLIPGTTSGSGTIYVDTYSGSTFVGTKYCGFTATVPASVKPTCSLTLDDVAGIDDIYGSPVKGLSRIKATIKATLAYGSPIVSYSISANGATYPAAEATTDVLKTAGTSRVSATITDQRGRVGTTYFDMNVQDYALPVVSALTVSRCNEDGTANEQGEFVKAVFSAKITALKNLNTAAYVLKYKKTSASSWTSVTLTALAGVYTVANHSYVFEADSNSSYDVEVTATDRHGSASRTTTVSTAFTLMNWGANGTSFAIGKVAEKANAVELGLRAYDQYGGHISNGMSLYGGSAAPIDADTTTEHLILTTVGTPTTGLWYVETIFYSTKLVTSDRRQTAMPYRRGGATYSRYYTAGAWSAWESEALAAWPVGSVYIAYNHTNPGTLFGGTWTRISNAFLWAVDSSGTIGQTGGSKTHTLTVDEMPHHGHGSVYSQHADGTKDKAWYTTAGSSLAYGVVGSGGGQPHNNMPPYIQVSVWRRTA